MAGLLLVTFFNVMSGCDSAKAEDRLDFWSLKPIRRPPMPQLVETDARWVRTPIDAYVIAKMRENGLAPSPEADRRTLIRRLYFD
jgi:hypothetical protein